MVDKGLLDNLECSYLDYAHAVLDFLRERIIKGDVVTLKRQMVFSAGSYGDLDIAQQDLWELIAQEVPWNSPPICNSMREHWDAIFVEMMQSDGLLPANVDVFEHCGSIVRQVFTEPLLQALQTVASIKNFLIESDISLCTDEVIVAQYRRICAMWLSPTMEWQVTAPLQYFDATALNLPMQASPDFSLICWTPEDKTQIWNNMVVRRGEYSYPQGLDIGHFIHADYCLRSTMTLYRNSVRDIQSIGANAVAVLTALRLIKSSPVRLAYVLMEALAGASTHRHYVVQNPLDIKQELSATKYQLLPNDVPLLYRLIVGVRLARGTPQPAGLGLALNRFDQSYSRESGEDMILDLTIALESTLLAGVAGEFSYKFALWGAALLASNRSPQETYYLLASMYQIRSKIVHEGQTLQQLQKIWKKIPGISDPIQFVEVSRNVTRDILSAYTLRLADGYDPKAVREQLERSVIEALGQCG